MNQPLFERYRPRDWAQVIGQDKAVKLIRGLGDRSGYGGRAWWISGGSGSGKTTLARLIAAQIADPHWATRELDGGDLGADMLAEIDRECYSFGWGKGGRAYIVNEAHGLRGAAVRKLLTMLEPIPEHVVWVFTTTSAGEQKLFDGTDDAGPLLSRCTCVSMAVRDVAKAQAARLLEIARAEHLDGQPIEKYVRLVNENHGNWRAALQAIESGAMIGGGA